MAAIDAGSVPGGRTAPSRPMKSATSANASFHPGGGSAPDQKVSSVKSMVVGHPEGLRGCRLEDEGRAGRQHDLVEHAHPVRTGSHDPAPAVAQEDLVVDVGPHLAAAVTLGGESEVEGEVAGAGAVAEQMPSTQEPRVLQADVVGRRVHVALEELAGGGLGQDRTERDRGAVREGADFHRAPEVLDAAVRHGASRLDVERTDPGVEDPLAPPVAAGEPEAAVAVRGVPVGAEVHLGHPGVHSLDGGIQRAGAVRDLPERAGKGVLAGEADGRAVGEAVVHGLRVGQRTHELAARVHRVPGDVAIEGAEAEVQRGSLVVARRLGDQVHHAAHGVRAPDGRSRSVDHLDPFEVIEPHRDEVPTGEAEEVLIDGTAIHQDELRGGERPGGAAARDAVVGVGQLGDVDARSLAEQVAEVARRRGLDHLGGDHRDRGRGVDDLLLYPRCRHDDLVGEARNDVGRIGRLVLALFLSFRFLRRILFLLDSRARGVGLGSQEDEGNRQGQQVVARDAADVHRLGLLAQIRNGNAILR